MARRAELADGTVQELPPAAFRPLLHRLLDGAPTLLDVGCGRMELLAGFSNRVRVGVDAHRPYLEHRVQDAGLVPVHLDADRLDAVFLPRSFTAVSLIDVIEHFESDRADALLRRCEAIASERVVVFTPRGSFPQEGYDAYGLGGEEYQRHRSVWEPADLTRRGYAVAVIKRFHGPGNRSFDEAFPAGAEPVDAILAWKNV